jgi:hypothetical protein
VLQKEQIEKYLRALNDELCSMDVKGEVCLYGGAVMCLAYDARPATKDVDAVFKPTSTIREAARKVATTFDLKDDWINDAVKGFVVQHEQRVLFDFPCLKVFVPEADYLLAMKAMAARLEGTDKKDVQILLRLLNLSRAEQVFEIIERYYPRNRIAPKTQFFIEELFGQ